MPQQKIVPFLWYDKEAGEAARFYASVFRDSKVKNALTLEHTPSGTVEILTAALPGLDIRMMSAGPAFKISPAFSFTVRCSAAKEVDAVWNTLTDTASLGRSFRASWTRCSGTRTSRRWLG